MKTSIAVLAVGLLGVLVGSLAAQQPGGESLRAPDRNGIIFDGNAEVVLEAEDVLRAVSRGRVRVYDGWVVIEGDRIVPRERVREINLNPDGQRNDFGDRPDTDPSAAPEPSQDSPPKRRPFRED